ALLRLLSDDEASAVQLGHVGRMAVMIAGDEGGHVGDGGVIGEDFCDGVDERALAVCAGAIGEDEAVLRGLAGQAIADVALEEAPELWIGGDTLEESVPQ